MRLLRKYVSTLVNNVFNFLSDIKFQGTIDIKARYQHDLL